MKIYLVGGAVRDKILNIPHKEKDWVVVGSTPQEMEKKGFRPVGKDFPVFLHPETQEEYALARTERKTGKGYKGFNFNTSVDVTLEDDLKRRDLTVNAIAEDEHGKLIDPYHGLDDLQKKILRHVSPAFVEDPVRVLRVARFAARYHFLGFHVAPETIDLMKKMVEAGEINALVAERVWKELERALTEKNPEAFFLVLAESDALPILFPEINIKQNGLQSLKNATAKTSDSEIRFAILTHDLTQDQLKKLSERYRIPSDYRDLALLVSRFLPDYERDKTLSAKETLTLLLGVDAFRREERFKKFLLACAIVTHQDSDWLMKAYAAAKTVNIQELIQAGFTQKALADKINEQRELAIQNAKQS